MDYIEFKGKTKMTPLLRRADIFRYRVTSLTMKCLMRERQASSESALSPQ